MAARKLISVVYSFRNEAEVLPELLRRMRAVFDELDHDFELIFVNDDSTDDSAELLTAEAAEDSRIRLLTMSSRFGVNPCFLAGMRGALGDAVITMDTDLQDPPELIPELVREWERGADVVHAARSAREGESRFKMLVTRCAYRVLGALSDVDLPMDTGMFKLMSRRVVDEVCRTKDIDPFLRGLVAWVGFEQRSVYYTREARHAGETHFPLLSRGPAHEFMLGLVSLSTTPLLLVMMAGLAASVLTLFAAAGGLTALAFGVAVPWLYWGFVAVGMICGLQGASLGVVGLYIARIYQQVQGRQPYIVADTSRRPASKGTRDTAA